MRRGWIAIAALCWSTLNASSTRLSAPIDADSRAVVTADLTIELLVTPHPGDAGSRIARRIAGDAAKWNEISTLNKIGPNLSTEKPLHIPFALLRPEMQLAVMKNLFDADKRSGKGWTHRIALERAGEGESLWSIAEWFTGDGANYTKLRALNKDVGLATRPGQQIFIPNALLIAPLRQSGNDEPVQTAAKKVDRSDASPKPAVQRPELKAATRKPADEKSSSESARDVAPVAQKETTATASSERKSRSIDEPLLTYEKVDGRDFAVYRLQRGEAIYSSVAVRFTGRVYAKDVNDAVDAIVKASGVDDVSRIAVNTPMRIPVDMLTPEFLPANSEKRVAYESSKRASARAAKRVEAKNLRGVWIILDAGHGGRDVGTTHADVWESTYVYDVACRLKEIIEKKSAARVAVTTRSRDGGYEPSARDTPRNRTDHVVLTTPEYELDDATVGVNFRWYLANSWYRQALEKSIAPEKVVFISLHADSLHPSLRGAMAYIPGQQYSVGSFTKKGKIYLTRAEVRESPIVSQSEDEALRAEGLSRELAESIIDSLNDADLPVHDFNPVRENVVRDGKEWVPAVIRYNKIPTRLLLEICNLGNDDDRDLIKTRKYRQSLARAIYDGIDRFFEDRDAAPAAEPHTVVAAGR